MVSSVSVFCVKQKTAYEMRISDWSSDVCSSDLRTALAADADEGEDAQAFARMRALVMLSAIPYSKKAALMVLARGNWRKPTAAYIERAESERSEERRVGQECVRTIRHRWWP